VLAAGVADGTSSGALPALHRAATAGAKQFDRELGRWAQRLVEACLQGCQCNLACFGEVAADENNEQEQDAALLT
jgi:hypothetical protein